MLQGTRSYVLQDENGNIELTHSISAGLDYAAVGPEHAWLHDSARAEYTWIGDADALVAFQRLAREEGILPALESSHAVAHACRLAPTMERDQILLVNLSGRGDKDVISVQKALDARAGKTLMSRIQHAFERLRRERRGGIVTYVTAGDPDAETLVANPRGAGAGRAPTFSRSACRSRIPWRTARSFSAPPSVRWLPA